MEKQAHRSSHKPLHKGDVLKGTDEKVFRNCALAVDAQSFFHARLLFLLIETGTVLTIMSGARRKVLQSRYQRFLKD